MNDRGSPGDADGFSRPDAARHEFDAIADVVDGGVLRVDADGRIVDADRTFRNRLATDGETAVGESLSTVFEDGTANLLRDALDAEKPADCVKQARLVKTASGQRREFDVDVRTIPESDGTGGVVVLRDSQPRAAGEGQTVVHDDPDESDAGLGENDAGLDESAGGLGDGIRDRDAEWSREQAEVLDELYEVAKQSDAPVEERIRGILSVVRDAAGTEYGTLARVEDDTYAFEVVDGPGDGAVTDGDTLPLAETNCERVVDDEETLVLQDIQSEAPELADHDGNQELELSCYLGAPVVLDDGVYGALCVYGPEICEFSERAVSLVEVAATLVEYELEQEQAKEGLRAERELLETTRQRYETLVENFPNGAVSLVDQDLRYTTVGGTPQTGDSHSADELAGQHVEDALPDELVDDIVPKYRSALEGERSEFEYENDGSFVRIRTFPVRDDDGNIVAAMGMSQDVTEQKEREQFLEDAKAQMEAAAEAGAVGTWEWHIPEDRFVAGASLAQLFGVDPDRAREGVTLEELTSSIHEDDREDVQAAIEAAVESCGEYEEEYRVYDADDELRWVVARGHVECDEDDNPQTFPGAITDITEQKQVERELDRQRKQLETLFGVLPVGVVVAEPDGELVEVNEVAEDIWGGDVFDAASVEEYDRYDMWWEDTGEPVAPQEATMAKVLRGETVEDPDIVRIEAADGQERILMVHGMPVFDSDGDVDRGVVTLTDITERREYQRKLEASNERLEQFAYAPSHDLQEPLRMVSSYLSLVESRYDDVLDEDGREFIEYAVDGADRMQEMIDALLQYSRVETEGEDFEPVDLDAVFEDVRRDYELKIEETDAEVTVESLPTVSGDEDQLREVFGNLLSNAIEYSGDEPPDVDVSAHSDGDSWVVAVEDDGIGIDPEHADRVFEVFHRLHAHDEHSGTGIGLALCERIVERHGGDIWVDSEPGDGATFYFSIPDGGQTDD